MAADDDFRDLFNEVAPPPEPSSEQQARARAHLRTAFRAAEPSSRRWWQQPAAAAGAVVVAVVVAGVLVLPTSTPPIDANLASIARVARATPPQDLPAGTYVYARTESLTLAHDPPPYGPGIYYLMAETIDVWAQGDSELETRLVNRPRFFSATDEDSYYASGRDEIDRVGESITTPLTGIRNPVDINGLATDTRRLREQIYAELGKDPDWTVEDEARTFVFVAQLMNPRLNAPSKLRAALIEIVGSLDVTSVREPNGDVTVSLQHEDEGVGAVLEQLEFDSAGYLIAYRTTVLETAPGVEAPAGLWTELVFSRPALVDEPGVLPSE